MDARERELDRWLETQLGGARFSRTPASDDASFRRYFRIHLDGGTRIAMDAPPGLEDCTPFVDVAARLTAAGVHVPVVHADDLERGFLLLDDLGDVAYLDRLDASTAPALYGDALETLVRMQRDTSLAGLAPYDASRLRSELELFDEWFLGRHLGIELGDRERRILEQAYDVLIAICERQPQRFVHRDYHSRNLMIVAERNPGVLDFQDAVVGPIAYDLVSLLRDVYVEWPDAEIAAWIADYHQRARDAGLLDEAEPEQLTRWFDLTGVQRHLKVAGIFCRLYHRDNKSRYLSDVPLTLRYLLKVTAHYRDLVPLAGLLDELDVLERSHRASARVPEPARVSS